LSTSPSAPHVGVVVHGLVALQHVATTSARWYCASTSLSLPPSSGALSACHASSNDQLERVARRAALALRQRARQRRHELRLVAAVGRNVVVVRHQLRQIVP
jgi:hypothetical protein